MNAIKAGTAYVLIVFAAGFVLGAIRVTFVAPQTGRFIAVLLEQPFMLTISWFCAHRLVSALNVPATMPSRIATAVTAFVLLMVIEASFGLAFGNSLAVQLQNLSEPAGILGLAGQLLFALMPILLLRPGQKN